MVRILGKEAVGILTDPNSDKYVMGVGSGKMTLKELLAVSLYIRGLGKDSIDEETMERDLRCSIEGNTGIQLDSSDKLIFPEGFSRSVQISGNTKADFVPGGNCWETLEGAGWSKDERSKAAETGYFGLSFYHVGVDNSFLPELFGDDNYWQVVGKKCLEAGIPLTPYHMKITRQQLKRKSGQK